MNNLSDQIRGEIALQGAISFARFMELALYCPDTGFYEKDDDTIGRRGDFYTSVSVGPVFGGLLAFQIAEWMVESPIKLTVPRPGSSSNDCPDVQIGHGSLDRYRLIEAGAHDGRLAKDILTWLQEWRRAQFEQVEYWIVEPSPRRREWQKQTLETFHDQVRWADSLAVVGQSIPSITGIIFANEMLDAMPVHRLGWDASRQIWFEWGVTCKHERFVWVRLPSAQSPIEISPDLPASLLEVLPDGFSTEVCPLANKWWAEAAGLLQQGKLLTLDYGLSGEEFYAPQRAQGTLRAFRNHRACADILADPGEQDITAHVNLSAIRAVGEIAGLRTTATMTQAQFLTAIAERYWRSPGRNGRWTAKQRREFQTLIHPQHLGRAFRVLVQTR